MPRPRRFRRVRFKPSVDYFKPAGVRLIDLKETILTVDEFESIRLKDLEELDQKEAAKKMGISQPTFHRLVLEARKKIAGALVNGESIKIEGGNYRMMQNVGQGRGMGRGRGFGGPAMSCQCPKCGHEEQKQRGIPCLEIKCPKLWGLC
jgi:predicted DNA-binding protein (UPF0251 family)